MKKNRMMRLASGLLVAVLATTSMISGTYAKYTTQDGANDVARVAKWGVELQAGGDLYGNTYKDVVVQSGEITVQAAGTTKDNVVAPGTKSETGLAFSLNGAPEVAGKVITKIEYENIYLAKGTYGVAVQAIGVTKDNFDTWGPLYTLDGNKYTAAAAADYNSTTEYYTIEDLTEVAGDYYPVEYVMTSADTTDGLVSNYDGVKYSDTATDLTKNSLKSLAEKIKDSLDSTATPTTSNGKTTILMETDFDPNDNLVKLGLGGQQIEWKWDFCNDSDAHKDPEVTVSGDAVKDSYCGADTILGNLMAGVSETQVVVAVTDGYENLVLGTATGTEKLVYKATDNEKALACLQTSFSIDITVTQVD